MNVKLEQRFEGESNANKILWGRVVHQRLAEKWAIVRMLIFTLNEMENHLRF